MNFDCTVNSNSSRWEKKHGNTSLSIQKQRGMNLRHCWCHQVKDLKHLQFHQHFTRFELRSVSQPCRTRAWVSCASRRSSVDKVHKGMHESDTHQDTAHPAAARGACTPCRRAASSLPPSRHPVVLPVVLSPHGTPRRRKTGLQASV